MLFQTTFTQQTVSLRLQPLYLQPILSLFQRLPELIPFLREVRFKQLFALIILHKFLKTGLTRHSSRYILLFFLGHIDPEIVLQIRSEIIIVGKVPRPDFLQQLLFVQSLQFLYFLIDARQQRVLAFFMLL